MCTAQCVSVVLVESVVWIHSVFISDLKEIWEALVHGCQTQLDLNTSTLEAKQIFRSSAENTLNGPKRKKKKKEKELNRLQHSYS